MKQSPSSMLPNAIQFSIDLFGAPPNWKQPLLHLPAVPEMIALSLKSPFTVA